MSITTVVFDRDNTLLAFDRSAVARLERQVAQAAPHLPAGAASAQWLQWTGPWPHTAAEEPAFWHTFWRTFAERQALTADATSTLLAIGDFYHTCFAAFPDALPCITALQERRLRLAVLTNFELPSIDRTLAHAGLDPRHFDALVSSAAAGVQKPDPRAYQAVLAALGEPAAACLMVDDLPGNVEGARSVGMRAVLLDRAGRFPDAPARITSLMELPQLIDSAPQ
jgi:putative hydrolase of the HAD superfamily